MDDRQLTNGPLAPKPSDVFEEGTFNFNVATGGYILPPYWKQENVKIAFDEFEKSEFEKNTNEQVLVYSQMPLSIKRKNDSDNDWFTFPLEPLVSLSYKNIIVRRNVAKNERNGSVKERWSQDDYEISISGILKKTDGSSEFPQAYIKRLLEIAGSPQAIDVMSDFFLHFNIKSMAVESINFPHTKGLDNQAFEIKGYSDYSYNLLIEV